MLVSPPCHHCWFSGQSPQPIIWKLLKDPKKMSNLTANHNPFCAFVESSTGLMFYGFDRKFACTKCLEIPGIDFTVLAVIWKRNLHSFWKMFSNILEEGSIIRFLSLIYYHFGRLIFKSPFFLAWVYKKVIVWMYL